MHVLLTPNAVVVHPSVWLEKPAGSPTEILEAAESATDSTWRSALETFDRYLSTKSGPRRSIHVTLSHHFVRFADVPWQPKILTAPLQAIQAEHRFRQLYGAASAGWHVTVSESTYGAPALAAAIEENLLTELQQIATKYETRFEVIEPWGIAPINAFRKQLRKENNSALVLVEEGKQVVLLFRGDALAGVTTRRGSEEAADKLCTTVMQEAMAAGLADVEQHIFVARCDYSTVTALDGIPSLGS